MASLDLLAAAFGAGVLLALMVGRALARRIRELQSELAEALEENERLAKALKHSRAQNAREKRILVDAARDAGRQEALEERQATIVAMSRRLRAMEKYLGPEALRSISSMLQQEGVQPRQRHNEPPRRYDEPPGWL